MTRLLAWVSAIWALAVAPLTAQVSIVAEAEISTTALTVGNNANLTFGAVPTGAATTVNPRNSANAGEFEIHGNRNAEILITFTLPDSLRVGTHAMLITFSNTAGCRIGIDWLRFLCTSFNPATPQVVRILNAAVPNNSYFVWVGGTVTPSATQPAGIYRGTITLTTAYTGN